MQIAVCDDNELHLLEMRDKLACVPVVENAYYFSDLAAFFSCVKKGYHYDAVLMDIDWERGEAGMDAAAELYKLNPEIKVIYVTGHGEKYSQLVFLKSANLSGFIAKPVDTQILTANLQKVADALGRGEQPALQVRRRGAIISMPFREILSIESRAHTVIITGANETVTAYERLHKIAESLPAEFYQCHKSFIVNMQQIRRFESDGIVLKNGQLIPVSRAKYNETRDAYLHFIGETF